MIFVAVNWLKHEVFWEEWSDGGHLGKSTIAWVCVGSNIHSTGYPSLEVK